MNIRKGTIPEFDEIYMDMETQFPPTELKSKEQFLKLIATKEYNFYIVSYDGEDIGYILILETKQSIWLDYVAVFKKHHSKGYGSKLIPMLQTIYKDKSGCFLEVERENEDDINTIRRVKFYKNLGATYLDFYYELPYEDGGFPMSLFYIPYKEKEPLKEEILSSIETAFCTIHSDISHAKEIYKNILNFN